MSKTKTTAEGMDRDRAHRLAKVYRLLRPSVRTDTAQACIVLAEEVAHLREALRKYQTEMCEGWCKENGGAGHFEDCGGCPAAKALDQQPEALKLFRVYYNIVGSSSHLFQEEYEARDGAHARALFKEKHPDERHKDREVEAVA